MATEAEKAKRKARGDAIRKEMRERQRAGTSSAGSGKFTPTQRTAAIAKHSPQPSKKKVETNMMRREGFTYDASTGRTMEMPAQSTMPQASHIMNPSQEQLAQTFGRPPRDPQQGAAAPGGWQNVKDVLGIALNPFSQEKIQANIQNEALQTGLQYVANNPYSTALYATTTIQIAKGILSGQIGKVAGKMLKDKSGRATIGRTMANPKALKLQASLYKKIFGSAGKATIVMAVVGNYVLGEWGRTEAIEHVDWGIKTAVKTGDPDFIKEITREGQEILRDGNLDTALRVTPGAAAIAGIWRKVEAAKLQLKAELYYAKAKVAEIEGQGISPESPEYWTQYQTEKEESEKRIIDYYNQTRIETEKTIQYLREKGRNEDMRAWMDYKKQIIELERQQMEEQRLFWIEYKKLILKMQEESRGSSLGFGLLR